MYTPQQVLGMSYQEIRNLITEKTEVTVKDFPAALTGLRSALAVKTIERISSGGDTESVEERGIKRIIDALSD